MSGATTKKMARLRLSPTALREVLQLPDGAEVVRVEMDPALRGFMNVVIEGAGWDVAEGMPIPPATAGLVTVDRNEQGGITRLTVDWGLPANPCRHQNTQAIDPAHNDGETVRCVDCGARRKDGNWRRP